jgi:hypothetical protein
MNAEYPIDALSIQNDKSNLGKVPVLDVVSVNLSSCEVQGTGPRYGQSHIPGQTHGEATCNLRTSEGVVAGRYSNRFGVFATHTQVHRTEPVPVWVCASTRSETTGSPPNEITRTWYTLDFLGAGETAPTSDVAAEFSNAPLGTLDNGLQNWRLQAITARDCLQTLKWVRTTQLSIGLADVSAPWLLADCIDAETATNCGNLALNQYGYDYSIYKRTYKNITVSTTFTDTGKQYFGRRFIWDANIIGFSEIDNEADTGPHFEPTTSNRQEQRLAAPNYTAGEKAVIYSSEGVIAQSHGVIAVATGQKALLAIFRDERDADNRMIQYCDPTATRLKDTRTMDGANSYKENGLEKATGWAYFPSYTEATPLTADSAAAYDGAIHVTLGAADSGLLRKGLIYEVAYSLYDASTGTETNVCTPAKFETGTDDFVAFSIFRNEQDGGTFTERLGRDCSIPMQKVPDEKVNYFAYRVYYRPFGSQEWLPAVQVWAVDLLFNGQNKVIWAAKAALGATIGGSPGQFNDYSPLPIDDWFDTAVFQNRFFWCSQKQAIFSLRNNALAYPLRNAISLPSGEFRGLTVHVFYGQSEQNGRVVFWASDAQYEGRFTGTPILWPVSVSPNYIAEFPLDGSDFIVQFRSSITAFSSRAAVVAEGALFFWGESGIYADSGVQPPNKISGPLEPWIGDVADGTKIKDIHCIYNDRTKEVIWFYTPKIFQGFLTEAIVFNAEKNAFSRYGFATTIDWSQNVTFTQEGARKRLTCGKRSLLGHSFALFPQRCVFFDEKNATGDLKHGREFLVKEVQALADGSRLILADGFDIPSFADIPVGAEFLISQAFEYTESENAYDNRYTITDIGTYYFDVSDTLAAATFADDRLMPIWIDQYSKIPYRMRTRYMMPGTHWQMFAITYLSFCLRLPKSILQNFTAGIFSNINNEATTQEVTMEANATSHCIRQLSYPHYNDTTHGIGFGLEFSGNANGASWRLDWFGIQATDGEDLTRFEQ